jgi:flagellar hook-length control protein FliK
MDANLNFVNAPTSKPASVGASSPSRGLDPNLAKPMSGQEFAGVMRDIMAKGERQGVAGTAETAGVDAASSGLQTVSLGNQFAVITATDPLPDPSSLAEFARSQGLSESAVQALFGDLVPAPDASNLAQMGLPQMGMMGLPNNVSITSTLMGTSTTGITSPTGTLTLPPNFETLGTAQGTVSGASVSNLLAAAGATGVIQAMSGSGTSVSNALGSADQLAEVPPELGPLDAMRMRMVPGWENMTRQLAQLKGSDQAAAWGQLTTNLSNSKSAGGEATEVLLDLGGDDPQLTSLLDSLQDISSNPQVTPLDSARNTASTGALGSAATSAALANPEMTDRAAQIQDLADKLGKAMGERLQEQLEKGEWKLQLKLNPGHLGKIDVELDMNKSGLDAVFKSDNQLTRELISQGMPKLKDSLSQSGMTVANVWVNSENQRQSGGNSTPRQQGGSDNAVNTPVKAVQEASATEARIRDLRSTNAWDTLA